VRDCLAGRIAAEPPTPSTIDSSGGAEPAVTASEILTVRKLIDLYVASAKT
jgi:hypothetical protein